ncbi:helix-turn-helix domain-containing protein [Nocardioides euryhalodurans]|uniref:Helix-turn-helix domain-containing protein n=1 Tax=Nocardioides euryhalodurans TaxID=2518370 RepID=A0A4P7GI85_9ACTN|nr:helix-turn-helix transcriptional regulator [Nocardioides euryhalodurans]QBR91451.1 helix-turn-helix domain-containing protein [Nocardioides euryhalodurans]
MSSLESAPVLDDRADGNDETEDGNRTALTLAPDAVEVRRNAGLAALVGGLASAVAIAYLARASATGATLDWVLAGVLGLLGVAHLVALVDARTPLLVADAQGVRLRLGRDWRGLPWGALSRVEHTPRRGLLRDGRLAMVVHNPARLVEELDRSGRRQSRLSQRLYGAPFAVPLGLTTRVTGAGDDLTAALAVLSGGTSRVVEIAPASTTEEEVTDEPQGAVAAPAEVAPVPEPEVAVPVETVPDDAGAEAFEGHDGEPLPTSGPRPRIAHAIFRVSGWRQRRRDEQDAELDDVEPVDEVDEPAEPEGPVSATPSPLREHTPAVRAEVRREAETEDEELAGREQRRPGSVSLVEDTVVWGERVSPIARAGHAVEPLLISDPGVEPAEDPVIGPEFAAARTRLGLTVDQLADRTRIRPHVIESIEVDDFAPCGGDFYARGHLRTLARVLGVDVAPLLSTYDDRYADAPINPRRVFEAELATGAHGSIRGTRGGPNWSVLVAVVMALVLAWSVVRLITDSPVELRSDTPVLNGSAGVDNGQGRAAPKVPVLLTAEGGGAQVVLRDGTGTVVFDGGLAFGESRTFQVSPPVRIQTSDGSLTATVDGEERGALGVTGERATDIFTVTG